MRAAFVIAPLHGGTVQSESSSLPRNLRSRLFYCPDTHCVLRDGSTPNRLRDVVATIIAGAQVRPFIVIRSFADLAAIGSPARSAVLLLPRSDRFDRAIELAAQRIPTDTLTLLSSVRNSVAFARHAGLPICDSLRIALLRLSETKPSNDNGIGR